MQKGCWGLLSRKADSKDEETNHGKVKLGHIAKILYDL